MMKDRYTPVRFRYPLVAIALLVAAQTALAADVASGSDDIRQRAFQASDAGAAGLAIDIARTRPEAFSAMELFRLEHASVAQRLRWAETEMNQLTGPERTDTLDQALVEGLSLLNRVPPDAEYASLRRNLAFDVVYGLTMRGRMQEAIALFESINVPWNEVYPYVLVAVGNAYAYEERLDPAIALFESALAQAGPRDIDRPSVRESLFYAYLDRGRYEDAEKQLEQIEKESPPWVEGAPMPERPNVDYQRYHRLRAQYLLYTGQTEAGLTAINVLQHDAPYSSSLRNAAASARMGDGRPLEARDAYLTALFERPNDAGAIIGLAQSSLTVRDYETADKIITALAERYPEVSQVRNVKREWEIYQSPIIEIDGGMGFGDNDAAAATAEREWSIDTRAYTAPINYNWRIFGHQFVGRAKLEDGSRSRVRHGIGLDYRSTPFEARGEVHKSTGSSGRYGVSGEVHYYPTDGWRLSLAGDSDSNDLPWKAYEEGIHGWKLRTAVRYQPSSRTYLDLSYQFSRYSDSNRRQQFEATVFQHLWARPRHSISAWVSLGHSRNSLQDRPYFSPEKDVTAQVTGMYEWNPWRNGQYAFKQRVYATAGAYDQTGFSAKGLWEVRLEQSWNLPNQRGITYGIGYGKRPYDGAMESRTLVYFSLSIPF